MSYSAANTIWVPVWSGIGIFHQVGLCAEAGFTSEKYRKYSDEKLDGLLIGTPHFGL